MYILYIHIYINLNSYHYEPLCLYRSGSQGLLKYSVVCLGPGDSQKVHDPTNEEEEVHTFIHTYIHSTYIDSFALTKVT